MKTYSEHSQVSVNSGKYNYLNCKRDEYNNMNFYDEEVKHHKSNRDNPTKKKASATQHRDRA